MLTRIAPVVRALNSSARLQSLRCMSAGHGHGISDRELMVQTRSTIDDLPVPSGSWQENHDAKNRKYNIQLAVATAFLIATAVVMKQVGCFYLHGPPPSLFKNK